MVLNASAVAGTVLWGVGLADRGKGAGMVQSAFALAGTVLWVGLRRREQTRE